MATQPKLRLTFTQIAIRRDGTWGHYLEPLPLSYRGRHHSLYGALRILTATDENWVSHQIGAWRPLIWGEWELEAVRGIERVNWWQLETERERHVAIAGLLAQADDFHPTFTHAEDHERGADHAFYRNALAPIIAQAERILANGG